MAFKFEIITPKGLYLEDEIDSLTIKLTSGYRTLLTGHIPLIGSLAYGSMHTIKNGKATFYAIHGGALNVTKDKMTVITNAAESESDIDVDRAQEAKKRAEERLAKKDINTDIKRAELALARALARIKAANRE
jgi:F-type H+-transporting ATPase subunit epsilon